MRALPLALAATLSAAPALAAEPVGCDRFAWDIRNEQRLMGDGAKLAAASGAAVAAHPPIAFRLDMKPFDAAGLPRPPERAPKASPSQAGFVTVAIPRPGIYKVTLSDEAWIDAVQDGAYTKTAAFSGVTGCAGVRKSVKFDLKAAPLVLQLTGASAASLSVAITPAE